MALRGTERASRAATVSPESVASAAVRVGEPGFVGGRLHWVTTGPEHAGAAVLVSGTPGEEPRVESPPGLSLRSALYLYGAGAWCASPLGLVGIDASSGAVGLVGPDRFAELPVPIDGGRLGDPTSVPGSGLIVAVLERPSGTPRVSLVAIDVELGTLEVLHGGDDFVAEPSVSTDGRRLAWTQWPRRTRPWDASAVWAGELDLSGGAASLTGARRVDGGPGCSAGQPTWCRDGALAYVSEATGYWQPYLCDRGGVVRRLHGRRAEFQRPRWQACRWLAAAGDDALACAYADLDGEHVGVLTADGGLVELDQPCVRVDGIAADATSIGWVGASRDAQGVVVVADARSTLGSAPPVRALTKPPTQAATPRAERFEFVHEGVTLTGVLWRATASLRRAHGATPLVVSVHPGPTGATDSSYSPVVHLLCASGFAVASVDVSGSTAHGRAYRERLRGRFGALDVAECAAAAAHLLADGVAQPGELFIRGASSGGTTALLALTTGLFAGAVAWYPASRFEDDDDEEGFEAGYLAELLGPNGAARSPLARAGEIAGDVLVVQGADDPVVTLAEAEALCGALRSAHVGVELVVLDGEGHGLRTAAARGRALEAELDFYRRHLVTGSALARRYDSASPGSTRASAAP